MKCSGVQITNHTTEIGCCDHMWDFNNLLSNFSFFYNLKFTLWKYIIFQLMIKCVISRGTGRCY